MSVEFKHRVFNCHCILKQFKILFYKFLFNSYKKDFFLNEMQYMRKIRLKF